MHSMNYIGKFFSNFKDFYNEINTATLTGAIDVIVVEQRDGSFNCSPFHVRFGKLGVLRSREKVVDIEINGEPADIHMKLGESGEAFFVEELEDDENEIPEHLATSPIPVSEFENIFNSQGRRRSFDLGQEPPTLENEVNNYTKRRNTGDIEHMSCTKSRERDFLKRQITLGNIGVGETPSEDISTVSLLSNTNKQSPDEDCSDTIFKMDSLDTDTSKSENYTAKSSPEQPQPPTTTTTVDNTTTTIKIDESSPISQTDSRSSKKKRRKTKKKNAPRKSSSVGQVSQSTSAPENITSQQNESATDPGSTESNSSEPELKEIQVEPTIQPSPSSNSRKIIDPDFHFFSDTELTSTAVDSRADSPVQIESVQSDSEFEVKNRKGESKENSQSWEWGGFPNLSQTNSPTDDSIICGGQSKNDQSMISNMFSFMKKNHQSSDGIYLSDIHSMDPQVASMYFSKSNDDKNKDADMDCESGNGPSLIQSPNSGEGCKSIDSDFDEQIKGNRNENEILLSLCGWDPEPDQQRFNEHLVKFSDFCNTPTLLENSNLVVSIRGKYYKWKVANPIITSLLIFNRPLLQSSVDQLLNIYMPTLSSNITTTKDTAATSALPISTATTATAAAKQQESSRSWWSWRRKSSRETTPITDGGNVSSTTPITTESVPIPNSNNTSQDQIDLVPNNKDTSIDIPEDVNVTTTDIGQKDDSNLSISPKSPLSDKYKKTLRLSSKQIASLNLRDGMNEIGFSVTTAYQGTTRCTCHLYKWKWDDKIVISDIDGTITKSDVLGHILPIVGKDWAQSGVAQLFNKIKDNGYKLLYLSARAIGQARITRDYLKSIKQGDLTMPDGPILLNPTSLITAFHREVIEKKPEQFKISCMSDIKALFPPDSKPFYAGYGNRINDVWAYRAVGIPIMRIFTINPKGELKHELTQTFQSSYSNMTYYVDQLFPPVIEASNDYSQFSYWRDPLPPVEELPELPE